MKKILVILIAAILFFGCKKQGVNVTSQTNPTPKIDTSTSAVVIDANMTQQTIYGFGGADIIDWTGDLTPAQRDTAFSPTNGIGLSIVRVRVPVDSTEFNQVKATIDACKSYGGFAIASVWSAPAYMKTNDSTIGGTIKPTS